MIQSAISRAASGEHLSRAEAESVMEEILTGRATEAQIRDLLAGLREKGESAEELIGFATAMRRHVTPIFPDGRPTAGKLVDTCGTGGDARGTFNISTCAAFVVAGAGARVAKHGNRSISSKCGSADVLEALGVNLNLPAERVGHCIEQVGIGFLFAPALHPAMRHAMAARRQLGGRTVFNLLGPLTNPAGATAQAVGVFDAKWTEPMARALGELDAERALVVHGADGLDEISLSGYTKISEWKDGAVRNYTVTPEDFGLPRAPLEAIAGGDAAQNAEIIRSVLDGALGPRRDIVVMNAAAALVAAGCAVNFGDGVRLAKQSVDSGAAAFKFKSIVEFGKN